MSRLVWLPIAVVVAFGAIQLIPNRIENGRTVTPVHWTSPATEKLFVAACADCHSNHTRKPWYAQVAPASWWLKNHVDDGRRRFNIDDCNARAERRRRPSNGFFGEREGGEDDITRTVIHGSMPPTYYTWLGLHSDAKLSTAQRQTLADGLRASLAASGCAL